MKNSIKISLLISTIVGMSILFSSCKKDNIVEPEYKGDAYFRVESVSKDGSKSYSDISRINIK